MWTTFLGKHTKPSLAEIVLALIPGRICNYQFCNRLDSLTLCNARTVTFKLVAVKNRCSWFTQLYICASYPLFVFVNCCAFIRQLLFVIICSFILFVVWLFCFHSHWASLFYCCSKEEKNNSDPELCSGISIPCYQQYIKYLLTTTCSTPSSRVNKHHTADSTDFVLV